MSQEVVIQETENKPVSYDDLKRELLIKIRNEKPRDIVSYFDNNKQALESIRNFIGNYSAKLTDNIIINNINDDAKNLLSDIADREELCYLGLYKLNEIERNVHKFCSNSKFWDWADTLTKIELYSLQNEQLDSIISKCIDELDSKNLDKYFDLIIQITEKNGSSNSLKVFSKLMLKLKDEIKKLDGEEKPKLNFLKKEADWKKEQEAKKNIIVAKASKIFESLNKIVEYHLRQQSYLFYLEMNPEEIEEICRLSKDITSKDILIKWLNPLMNHLIAYYVSFGKSVISKTDISSLWDNWKLGKIFEIVYENSSDADLQGKILDSFSVNNTYLPYLPINIIQSTFNQKQDDKVDRIKVDHIIYYLKNRYEITNENEKKIISTLNDKIIFDESRNIELREEAFNWYYEQCLEKEVWCQKIITCILKQNLSEEIQRTPAYTNILKKCFSSIPDKNLIQPIITQYITIGKNKTLIKLFHDEVILSSDSSENLEDLITMLIELNNDDKITDICDNLNKLYVKKSGISINGKKGLIYICQKYKESSYKEEIKECLKSYIINGNHAKSLRLEILREVINNFDADSEESFIDSILTSDIEFDELIKLMISDSKMNVLFKLISKNEDTLISKHYDSNTYEDVLNFLVLYYKTNKIKECSDLICDILLKTPLFSVRERYINDVLSKLDKVASSFIKNSIGVLFSNENTSELNLYLLDIYFQSQIESAPITSLKSYIDYLWENRGDNKFIESIINSICGSNNIEIIKYLVLKGWK